MKVGLAQICQVCGHEEDVEECPTCSRFTCQECFNDINEQGFEGKSCLYCGHVWFEGVDRTMDKPLSPRMQEAQRRSRAMTGDSYSERFGVAIEEENHFTRPTERHRLDLGALDPVRLPPVDRNSDAIFRTTTSLTRDSDARFRVAPDRHIDIETGDIVTVDESGDVSPFRDRGVRIERSESQPISTEYNQVVITLSNHDGSPFNLTGATVTWGDYHGSIGVMQLGEVKFTISRNDPVRREQSIKIRKDGIIYRVGTSNIFDSLHLRLPEPDETRRMIEAGDLVTVNDVGDVVPLTFPADDEPVRVFDHLQDVVGIAASEGRRVVGTPRSRSERPPRSARRTWPPPTTEAYRTIGGEEYDWQLGLVKFLISIGGLGVLLIIAGLLGL